MIDYTQEWRRIFDILRRVKPEDVLNVSHETYWLSTPTGHDENGKPQFGPPPVVFTVVSFAEKGDAYERYTERHPREAK